MHKIPVFQFTTDKFLSWLNPAPLASIYLHALALTSLNPGTNFNHMYYVSYFFRLFLSRTSLGWVCYSYILVQ